MKKAVCTLFLLSFGILVLQAQMEERLGDKLFDLGEYQKAMAQYMQCLEGENEAAGVKARMADCYFRLNQAEQAAEWYERSLETGTSDAAVHLRYGHCLKFMGQYEAALKQYEAYRTSDPERAEHFIRSTEFAMNHRTEMAGTKEIVKLSLNSRAPDFGPAFYRGQLIFSSYRGVHLPTGVVQVSGGQQSRGQSQLYTSSVQDETGSWSAPAQLQSEVQTMTNVGPIRYNASGTMVVFTKNNFRKGIRQVDEQNNNLAIYLAETTRGGTWEHAKAFPHNGMGYSTTSPCFAPDGNTLYFASNMQGGQGGYDIYFSRWTGTEWTEPKNLGVPVNSPGNEWVGTVENDRIYFSSDWHPGFGGMDLFECAWDGTEAGEIRNLGYGINSSRDEYGFLLDEQGRQAYFTSNRTGGSGYEDLYRFAMNRRPVAAAKPTEHSSDVDRSKTVPPLDRVEMKSVGTESESGIPRLVPADNGPGGDKKIDEVYSIQIAVFQDKETDVARFAQELGDIGDVYKLYFDRVIKIRVGNFSLEEDARKALNKVHVRGFEDAFIVREQIIRKIEQEKKRNQAMKTEDDMYKVRLAAYSNPKWFDPSSVEHLGLISTRKQDGFTIVYLGDYPTIEEAEATRVEAMDAGFTSAQLVRVDSGTYSVVR